MHPARSLRGQLMIAPGGRRSQRPPSPRRQRGRTGGCICARGRDHCSGPSSSRRPWSSRSSPGKAHGGNDPDGHRPGVGVALGSARRTADRSLRRPVGLHARRRRRSRSLYRDGMSIREAVSVDGTSIVYRVTGNSAGTPLVLLHGWAQSSQCWGEQVLADLAADYRLISPSICAWPRLLRCA